MRTLTLLLTSLLAVVAPMATMVLTADAASAATNRPCITRAEFNAIDVDMRPAQVERIVGSLGREMYHAYGWRSYDIRHCAPSRVPAMVNFDRRHGVWRMSYAIWMPARD
jgi:hypothetical protein